MNDYKINAIDSHIHCGIQNVNQSYRSIQPYLKNADIVAACFFAPVEDIYDRSDYNFKDNESWKNCREKANEYLLRQKSKMFYPYFFVWNDFKKDELSKGYMGIKWHRHSNEPKYLYEDPKCEDFLQEAYRLKLPIVLEEEFENTIYLVERIHARTTVIIPHLGFLNGGYDKIKKSGIWQNEKVWADTALADNHEIIDFIKTYGPDKLIYGSDYPFGIPLIEKNKILSLKINDADKRNILYKNIQRLLNL